jgi:NAD(P)-dependent dehydrogenase (short-subunit alcohol dehydrogenase family)
MMLAESAVVRRTRGVGEARGRRGVVTGAASGIGLAAARRLLAEGASVLAVDVNAAGLEPLRREGAQVMVADLGQPADRTTLIAASRGVHYLVNAAGIIRIGPIFEATVADWRDIFTINAESIFFLCQGIGPHMPAGGAIVNLSSSSAKLASTIEVAIYAASKTAILSITRSFAYALAPKDVRVNAICPGIVDTPMQERVLERVAPIRGTTVTALSDARLKTIPLGRAAPPEECANFIWFLLSSQASYLTGQSLDFSGGLVTW